MATARDVNLEDLCSTARARRSGRGRSERKPLDESAAEDKLYNNDEDEEDWEYYLSFPTPVPASDGAPDVTDSSIDFFDFESEPVVILLGWAGCEDRYLAKYSSFYENAG